MAKGKLKVFLCHASENKPIVKNLHKRLAFAGYEPWLDSEVLLPGMDWDLEIQKALHASDAVIVCLSRISIAKEGYIQKELKIAQEIQDEKPAGTIFLIPLRLDKCKTPDGLQHIQWADYTASDGFEKLVKGLNLRAKELKRVMGGESIELTLLEEYFDEPKKKGKRKKSTLLERIEAGDGSIIITGNVEDSTVINSILKKTRK